MSITYQPFQTSRDLMIQKNLFIEATKELPWAWKPNRSQEKYFQTPNFDPNSKLFAYENEKPIGYASCVRWEAETPIGYPWILKGYEGNIQDYLFDTIYDYAVTKLKSRYFLQRFRKEWTHQIDFFKKRGFTNTRTYPIFILDLHRSYEQDNKAEYQVNILENISKADLLQITRKDPEYKNESETDIVQYFANELDLDCIIQLTKNKKPVAISGMASRKDLDYSEIMLLAINQQHSQALDQLISSTIAELAIRGYKNCSITLNENDPQIDGFESFGFNKRSESVYYTKTLA